MAKVHTTEPQQLEYFKSVFIVILNVPIRTVFTETVTNDFDLNSLSLSKVGSIVTVDGFLLISLKPVSYPKVSGGSV